MADNRGHCWAEKWVLKAGKRDFDVGKSAELAFLIIAAMTASGLFFLLLLSIRQPEIDIIIPFVVLSMATVGSVLLAFQHFEHRHFYKIIHEQKEKIDKLEKELCEKNMP